MTSPINLGPVSLPLRPVTPEDFAAGAQRRRSDPADAALARAETAAARSKATLEAIREKGLYAWAQEEKYKALREKIERQVRQEMGLDEAAMSKLNDDQRASLEARIQAEIQRRIEEALKQAAEEEQKTAAATGKPPAPMIIDISV